MDKKTSTLSCRTTPEREIAAKALAGLDGHSSVSELLDWLLERYIAEKRDDYLKLSAAFGVNTDLQR